MYNKGFLLALWIVQITLLSPSIRWLLLFLATYPKYREHHRIDREGHIVRSFIIASVCSLGCLFFVIFEIRRYNRRRLDPSLYLKVQVSKSLLITCSLILTKRYTLNHARSLILEQVIELILNLLVFYTSLAYAVYLFCRHRGSKRVGHGIRPHAESASRHTRSESYPSLQPPVESPWVIEVIQWIYHDPAWNIKLHVFLEKMLRRSAFVARYVIGIILVAILFPFSGRLPGEMRNPMSSDSSSLDAWDYPKPTMKRDSYHDDFEGTTDARRTIDEESGGETLSMDRIYESSRVTLTTHVIRHNSESVPSTRQLGPRYLCFLTHEDNGPAMPDYTVRKCDNSLATNKLLAIPDYIFVSYTRKQFYTETAFDTNIPPNQRSTLEFAAARDKKALTNYAVVAAKAAGVSAFWVDFECVRPEENTSEGADMEDVYRICDIVRSSHSLVVVLGPSLDENLQHSDSIEYRNSELLLEWGKRLWTVPEALLCPSKQLAIYTIGLAEPELVAKRNLAVRVWEDADILRQLLDHYEGSLHLTQLELISIALECLSKRQTNARNPGDVIYVLMGLLRLRPKVNKADTDFQAFARLSLANDSDKILERILSLRSTNQLSLWHNMQDTWDSKLWHLDPLYQIAAISSNSTVTIGDASGTIIDWTSLKSVDFKLAGNNPGWWVSFSRGMATTEIVWLAILWFEIYMAVPFWKAYRGSMDNLETIYKVLYIGYGIFLVPCTVIVIIIPEILSRYFRKEFIATQARFFGIPDKPNLQSIEQSLFGACRNRLRWDPDSLTSQDVHDSRPVFTLIDTLSCTATTFRAETPPTIAFIAAREHGKLRTLLCSYDPISQAFVKEDVIRMDNKILQSMPRIDAFRFTVSRTVYRDTPPRDPLDLDMIDIPDIPEFRSL